MALKIRFVRPHGLNSWAALLFRVALLAFAAVVVTGFAVFAYYYFKYQGIVDERLKQPIFANTAKIYAAPREVRPGQQLTLRLISNEQRVRMDLTGKPEFDGWRWVSYWYPLGQVVTFKREVYRRALKELAPRLLARD